MKIRNYYLSSRFGGMILFLVVACLLSFFAFSPQPQTKIEKKGLVTYTDGRVKKKQIDEQEWKNAAKDTTVLGGDRVRTYQRSRAELELLELDFIRIAPETIIDIVKLYEETKQKIKETQISVQEGDIWANINKKKDNTKFRISAPVAVAAITGTILRIGVDADSTTELKVYNGEVQITNAPEKTDLTPKRINVHEVPGPYQVPGPHEVSLEEWIYIIKNMQKIVIDKKGQVTEVGEFKKTDKDEQTDWVKWNLQRDNKMR
jgi:hypothetical protein